MQAGGIGVAMWVVEVVKVAGRRGHSQRAAGQGGALEAVADAAGHPTAQGSGA